MIHRPFPWRSSKMWSPAQLHSKAKKFAVSPKRGEAYGYLLEKPKRGSSVIAERVIMFLSRVLVARGMGLSR